MNGSQMEALEVKRKSNGRFGSQIEVVGSGMEVDGNFHALAWKFLPWKLVEVS